MDYIIKIQNKSVKIYFSLGCNEFRCENQLIMFLAKE